MSLFSLVYVSVATEIMNETQLVQLLEECRSNNLKINVTGMLLYHHGYFIQVLEGEEQVVRALYDDIARDPRHSNTLTVHHTYIDERHFGSWAMGFNNLSKVSPADLPGFTDFLQKPTDAFFADNDRVLLLLDTFRQQTYF